MRGCLASLERVALDLGSGLKRTHLFAEKELGSREDNGTN
jgi:hypothetical protein